MSNARCLSRSIHRSFLPAAFALLAGLGSSASAQVTAPQLLPYTVKLVAGSGTAAIAKGVACPLSGFIATDAFGDGCLATEVKLNAPRFVTTDKNGVVFFSDSGNALVRRIDPATGIITAVAGGAASSPGSGTTCGANTSTDSHGDGCLANAVLLSKPEGLAFASNGDLYFADNGFDDVRKVAATAGVITTTGVIGNIVGTTTFGYNVNNTSTSGPVVAATQGYLNFPYGIAFDPAGNLYISDEGNNALEVINLGTATATIQGMSVPAGTIAKFAGYGSLGAKTATSGDCPDFTSTATGARGGCYFGKWTDGTAANVSNIDGNYDIAIDPSGNIYFANEFNDNVGLIVPGNILTNYAGIQGSKATVLSRATAGSFAIGSNFNVAVDASGNVYTSDDVSGVIWRVDAGTKSMYVVAGGASTTCSSSTDAYGDGCPATQAHFSIGTLNTSGFATAPGVAGLFVDSFGSLYVADATTSLIRMASSGTEFGNIGANQPTDIVDIHFARGDSAAASAYSITAGAAIFSLGSATCTANSDLTNDCLLPITASPTALGSFAGTLQVKSTLGAVVTFPLSGTYVTSPFTRTSITYTAASSCTGTSTYSTATPVTFTATVASSGGTTGTVTFFANGTQIGTPQTVSAAGVATLTNTFSTPATYNVTATYNGDSYFKPSTTPTPASVTSSAPTFSASQTTFQQNTVVAGQTALYSFSIAQNVYAGTITMTCSGLPANSSCAFSPNTITAGGCTTTNTVALSILTQQGTAALKNAIGLGGRGPWAVLSTLAGLGLALLIGIRRRRSPLHYGQLWMALALLLAASGTVACSNAITTAPSTPSGTYSIVVTSTGSTGVTSSVTVPLTVK